MEITCLIIDDEPLARKRLLSLVEKESDLSFIGEAKTGKEAIKLIDKLQPNLIFLDIQMKDMTGFEVLEIVKHKPIVIFVTAFDTYAIKAFDYFAFDYLLKPFKKKRFHISVKKAIQHIEQKSSNNINIDSLISYIKDVSETNTIKKYNKKLAIKTGKSVTFLDINTIIYICASGSYAEIFTETKKHLIRSTLTNLLKEFTSHKNLFRIHRSTIINIDFIDKMAHSNFGEINLKMKDNKQFRVSKSFKKEFQKILGV